MDSKLAAAIQKAMSNPHESSPDEYKQATIIDYGRKYNCDLLIETGTNRGDTVEAVKKHFANIYSIELGPQLYMAARKRFAQDGHVHLVLGDSGDVLKELLPTIIKERKILFYLDAHSRYDETSPKGRGVGTAVPEELEAIMEHRPDSVVLIDDARLFTHQFNTDWPKLEDVITYLEKRNIWAVTLEQDIIRLVPRGTL